MSNAGLPSPGTNSSIPQHFSLLSMPITARMFSLSVTSNVLRFLRTKKKLSAGFEADAGSVLHKPTPSRGSRPFDHRRPHALLHPLHPRSSSLLLVSHGLWRPMSLINKEDRELSRQASGLPHHQPRYVTRLSGSLPKDARSD